MMTADELAELFDTTLGKDILRRLDALGYCIMPKEADNRICEAMLDGLGSSILHGSDAWDHPRPQSMYRAAVATGSIKLEKAG